MNYLIRRVFERRGYSDSFFFDINKCDHPLPVDIDKLCERLEYHRAHKNEVTLLTDFDMDGITSGVLGYAGLAELGFAVNLFIPDVSEGYGFDDQTVDRLLNEYPATAAILTADVGITAYAGIKFGRDNDVEMLVTDHHTGQPSPDASVVVDPCGTHDEEGYDGICGAHVLYLVLSEYARKYAPDKIRRIERLRVFAGFGTISDTMPMLYENRPLVRDAVDIARAVYAGGSREVADRIDGCDVYRRAFLGLHLLFTCFAKQEKISTPEDITEEFIGYYVAPCFNAVKRMNADLHVAYDVFFGVSPEESMEELYALNQERRELVKVYLEEMKSADQPYLPYVYITDAPSGFCGLLAQQVIGETGEPAFVVRKEGAGFAGSGRCPSWFPFLTVAGDSTMWQAKGHPCAFGISFESAKALDALCLLLDAKITDLKPPAAELALKPDFIVSMFGDGDCGLDIPLFDEYLDEVDVYRPFGPGFPEPEGLLRIKSAACYFSVIGKEKSHLKIQLPYGLVVLCFNQAHLVDGKDWPKDAPDVLEIYGRLNRNNFNGTITVQFIGSII